MHTYSVESDLSYAFVTVKKKKKINNVDVKLWLKG